MSYLSMQYGERFVSKSAETLNRLGISLTVGYDFEEYIELLKEARPDHIIGAPFDPNIYEMDATNALWMVGRNERGKIMHTQALRMMDMGKLSVGDYFLNNFRDFPPSGVDLDLARSRYRAGPGAFRMHGRVAYHGEFWIGGEPGEYRGSGISCVLGRFGFWEALQHWDPDHIVAFMVKAVAYKGLAERTGWMHTEPGALNWYLRGNDSPVEGFMAYMDREDLHYVLEVSLSEKLVKAA